MIYENLQKAGEILEGVLTVNFKSAGETRQLNIAELPAETLAIFLDYGVQKLNDKVNTLANSHPETGRLTFIAQVLQEAIEGRLGEKRRAISSNKPFRDFVLNWIKSNSKNPNINKLLEPVKGSTVKVIIDTALTNATPEAKQALEDRLQSLWEEMQNKAKSFDIAF